MRVGVRHGGKQLILKQVDVCERRQHASQSSLWVPVWRCLQTLHLWVFSLTIPNCHRCCWGNRTFGAENLTPFQTYFSLGQRDWNPKPPKWMFSSVDTQCETHYLYPGPWWFSPTYCCLEFHIFLFTFAYPAFVRLTNSGTIFVAFVILLEKKTPCSA